jgi:hypothetical protein
MWRLTREQQREITAIAAKRDEEIGVLDGVLTVGEAKRENELGQSASEENAEIKKYLRIAKGLSARQVVFATLSPAWGGRTLEKVAAAFGQHPWVKAKFVNGADLLQPRSQ